MFVQHHLTCDHTWRAQRLEALKRNTFPLTVAVMNEEVPDHAEEIRGPHDVDGVADDIGCRLSSWRPYFEHAI